MGKKEKQEELPGLERRDVPEIEQAADRYRQIRDERCEISKQEAEAKAALIQVMKNKGRQFYSYNGLNVQLSNQENVKVKAKDEDEEPVGTFTQPARRKSEREIVREAEELIEKGQELIERQQAAETSEGERERLHKEAVANWRRERPASAEGRKCECGDYEEDHAESGGCMLAACDCTEFRPAKVEEEGEGFQPGFPPGFDPERAEQGLAQGDALNINNHSPTCYVQVIPKGQTTKHSCNCELREQYQGAFAAQTDDFTAERCDECGRIDGGHAPTCSQSDTLTYDDYFRYSQAYGKGHYASHARKMDLKRDPKVDAKVREWQQQAAGNHSQEA